MALILQNAKLRPVYDLLIGVDTGENTGFAVYCPRTKVFLRVDTLKIHQAWFAVVDLLNNKRIKVYVEDARLRTWFGKGEMTAAKKQGAGSVKRDASAWEDFLTDLKVPNEMVHPKNVRDLNALNFKQYTGWKKPTNQHSRDAGMIVWGR